jgi:hypothetical protein
MKRATAAIRCASGRTGQRAARRYHPVLASALAFLAAGPAAGFEIETGVAGLKASWDTVVKYTAAWRTQAPSATLTDRPPATINQDDGDRNFSKGMVGSRIDIFSEADVTYRDFGVRVSAAGWYDWVYNRSNDNNSPNTANQYSVPFDQFTNATRKLMGRDFELLDAFAFGKGSIWSMPGSFRVGRHALLWGESLFFGNNGIAGSQAPVDVNKLLSIPNSQFKEVILPVGQVSGQLQVTPTVSIAGYYQYQWTQSQLPAAGAYLSNIDILDFGGERILAGPPLLPQGMPAAFYRGVDQWASDAGQGGVAFRIRLFDSDFGLYAVRWHSKTPQIYIRPSILTNPGGPPIIVDPGNFDPRAGKIGTYFLTYPEAINTLGASASTSIGDFNFGGEISFRSNAPLVSDAQMILPGVNANNSNSPLYAVGHSAHAQFSMFWTVPPTAALREATVLAEVAWNRRNTITNNPSALDPDATRDATSMRVLGQPIYRQVLPGVDLAVPIGASYTWGRSSTVGAFGVDKGGDWSIGISAAYLVRWQIGVNYTHYYGPAGTFLNNANHLTFAQSLADRNFVSLSLSTTF